jgi:2-polyprenyl-3-methyl-5-hydroxy-6-metoxy-1,4-benzoquinol methylase
VRREDWDERYAQPGLVWSAEPNRFLVAEVAGLQPGRALDLACGEGRNSVWLAERGWKVTAVDFSEVAIGKARERAAREGQEVELVCADLVEYEPPAEAYDLVLLLYLHVPAAERRTILSRAAAALRPGGTFLLLGHDLTNQADGVGGPRDTSILYTPADIVVELPELRIEKAERVLRDVEGEDRPAIDALVRAHRPSG